MQGCEGWGMQKKGRSLKERLVKVVQREVRYTLSREN